MARSFPLGYSQGVARSDYMVFSHPLARSYTVGYSWCVARSYPLGFLFSLARCNISLAFANPEHFRAAYRANPLSRRPTILHGYGLGILHFPFGMALYTISLHFFNPPLSGSFPYPQ